MSWDDPSTDMAHCAWCSWDLMKADAGDDHMHPECRVKWNRRNTLREALIPALIEMGECMLGEEGHRDYWGNYVPSRHEVEAGSKGSPEYCKERSNDNG